jgi:universal stress protein E
MSVFARILYAVKNPDPRHEPGLAKAVALARACDASLELFHAISTPLFLPVRAGDQSIADLKRDTLELHTLRLEKLAARARRHGIKVTCCAVWDYPPHEAILRRAAEIGADLIVAPAHAGKTHGRLLRLTEWELLRTSAVPVLLVRNVTPYRRPAVLAAIDPTHAHAKPADLDENILVNGRALAAALGGRLHVVHAEHTALPHIGYDLSLIAEDILAHDRTVVEDFVARADLNPGRTHLVHGDPVRVVPRVARETGARIVVMGAVSRTGLKRLFIGDTAERLLDKLSCDVLVVRPDEFHSHVPPQRREAVVLSPTPATAFNA